MPCEGPYRGGRGTCSRLGRGPRARITSTRKPLSSPPGPGARGRAPLGPWAPTTPRPSTSRRGGGGRGPRPGNLGVREASCVGRWHCPEASEERSPFPPRIRSIICLCKRQCAGRRAKHCPTEKRKSVCRWPGLWNVGFSSRVAAPRRLCFFPPAVERGS